MRVAVAGFIHETNTFSPHPADLEAFVRADGWPPLVEGPDIAPAVRGMNLPVAGFLEAAAEGGAEAAPVLWCSAVPSGPVAEDAHRTVLGRILDGIRAAGPLDAVFLDLHGAMAAAHDPDGDGAVLAAVREAVGPRVAVAAALDLHANVSRRMLDSADALVAFRTYPHVDMADTGRRAFAALGAVGPGVAAGRPPGRVLLRGGYLVPIVCQSTAEEPARGLYAALAREDAPGRTVSLAMGFPPADVEEAGPSVFAYGPPGSGIGAAAGRVAEALARAEGAFARPVLAPDAAVAEALRIAGGGGGGPVVIADTRDNAGAGGASDTTGMLAALAASGADGLALGLVCDPDAAARAHAAGAGAEIELALGGRSDGRPFRGRFRVEGLGDGRFTATGPMFGGAAMELGPMAALRTGGVAVAVSSSRMQAADRSMFRHVGIEPDACRVVVLKSSVHFRADFAHARAVVVADAPGLNPVDHDALDYRRLRAGVRRMPRAG